MATYTTIDSLDQVNSIDRVFASAWSENTNDLGTNHFTSSAQYITSTPSSSGNYFAEIYNKVPTGDAADATAEVQYSIAYGNRVGSGSALFNSGVGAEGFSATKAIYSQYRNLVFGGDETQNFTFDGYTPDDIYVININRARYKSALRLGNLKLVLSGSAPEQPLFLTDDSVTTSGSANALRPGVGRELNLVSGSNGVRLGSSNTYVTNSGSYDLVYPDAGLIILNADALDHSGSLASLAGGAGGINLETSQSNNSIGDNNFLLRQAIVRGGSFILDSQEDISSVF